jgi:hypothetical protein
MTNDKKIEVLNGCFEEVIWMAIRYANGRHTYAPDMVRDAVKKYKEVNPDFVLKHDITIEPPEESDLGGMRFRSDYLYDLFVEFVNKKTPELVKVYDPLDDKSTVKQHIIDAYNAGYEDRECNSIKDAEQYYLNRYKPV